MMVRQTDHRELAGRLLCLVLLSACLTLALSLGLPSQALADAPPGNLEGMVAMVVRENADGPVAWARYVATTPEVAAELLGKRRGQLFGDMPERVYLVVLHGDLAMPGSEEGRGPYLAFLYWRSRDTWEATDFTLLERPVPLRDAGVPHAVRPIALTHPTLDRALRGALVALFWFLPPLLLVTSAALLAWKRNARWPCTLAACVAAGTAVWQAAITMGSMAGQSWDPGFHGIKLAVLAVVLGVDLAAVILLLRRRSRLGPVDEADTGRQPRLSAGALLVVVAAVLYVPSLFWLATTGA